MDNELGSGKYTWIDLDGDLQKGSNWDKIPEKIRELIEFNPCAPDPPHTQEQHDYMETFNNRLKEAMKKCQR